MMAGESDAVAVFDGAGKSYGAITALDGIDLSIRSGQVTALLGPNGAGKTTALELLIGLRHADRGRVNLFGGDPRQAGPRRRIGVTPQETDFPPGATPREILHLIASHYRAPLDPYELIRRLGLDAVADRPAGGFSGGQKRLLALASAFVGNPDLIILDEPTTALDVGVRRDVWAEIGRQAASGRAVLLTTHALEEAEALADRIVVFREGRIIADGSVAEIAARAGARRMTFEADVCPDFDGVATVSVKEDRYHVLTADADEAVRRLVASGVAFRDLEVSRASLEEAFLTLTGRAG